jgi:hypothetical protein
MPYVIAMLLSGGPLLAAEDREIYSAPAPLAQQNTGRPTEDARITSSITTGQAAVSIPLDETGIADWRFVNPRNPQIVAENAVVEFTNQTTDRTFEITTSLALRPAELVPEMLATIPLLVHDALTTGTPRPDPEAGETLFDYESRLIGLAKRAHAVSPAGGPDKARWGGILDHVLELESALRDLAKSSAEEAKSRTDLLELRNDSDASVLEASRRKHEVASDARLAAERRVAVLSGDQGDLAKERAPIIEWLVAEAKEKRRLRSESNDPDRRQALGEESDLLNAAAEGLATQSADSALVLRLRMAIPSVRLSDCTVAATVLCTAAIQVYPNGSGQFPHEVLLFQADPTGPARFDVKFFEEEDTPARPTAYLVAESRVAMSGPPRSVGSIAAVAGITAAYEPFLLDRSAESRNCPFLCPDKPFTGEERSHTLGSGRVDITQTYGNLLDGKVSFSFKEGDLGGGNANLDVKLSQYRFNIYSHPGLTFHYGKYTFAAPSSGIAINESGEGARVGFHNYALSRLVKRESGTGIADAANRDHEVWILEANNVSLNRQGRADTEGEPNRRFLRTMSAVYLRGNDRQIPQAIPHAKTGVTETFFTGHNYETYGGQLNFAVPKKVYGSFAAYRSDRSADERDALCGSALHVCDGRGVVTLLTATHPFAIDEDGKARRTVTLTIGQGTGDDPTTAHEDEGYIGETATFAPDLIFLSTLSASISSRPFVDISLYSHSDPNVDRALKEEFHRLDSGALGIGRGLSNKRYLGLRYVDNEFSPLAWLVREFLDIPVADIKSKATIVTLNGYRLREAAFASDDAGYELDVEFQVETPRGVKGTVKAGYYRPGSGVELVIPKDVWTASAGISISL